MKLFTISNKYTIDLSPPSVLALGFLLFILLGTLLLKLPFASIKPVGWLDAFFTATSAVTITGLSVVDVGSTFSVFGQLVITALIQIGGLGFMTFAIIAAMSLSARMGVRHQAFAQDALGQTSLSKVGHVAKAVFFYTIFFEVVGVILLTLAWHERFGWLGAAYHGLFYSISAFNNAGFSLFADSMSEFAGHFSVNMIISSLYIIGGIGFAILMDVRQNRSWSRLQTNTKVVLTATAITNLLAFIIIWGLEASNPHTLGNMPVGDQALAAWFQATVPRSSGFNSVPTDQLTNASTILTMFLMFIGGGSLSTAGGIKIGTFVILLASTYAFLRRHDDVRVFKHTVSQNTVMKALAVTMVTVVLIFIGIFLIAAIEKQASFIDVTFEVVSAACTVGLSRGLTGQLSGLSQMIIIFMMFAGRLGPLTLAYFIATPHKSRVRYPSTDIQIG